MKLRWMLFITIIVNFEYSKGALRRCFECRSRGELGTCKDPFRFNSTSGKELRGLETIPCASGWCAKIVEGGSSFSDSVYGEATQRMCLPRGPSDSEERCAKTDWNHKKVFMCFCQGDLCNSAPNIKSSLFISITMLIMYFLL